MAGVENLCKAIPAEITSPGREALGILADANSDLEHRWGVISSKIIEAAGYGGGSPHLQIKPDEIPHVPEPTGTIIHSNPRIGIWLMPCNESPGELEDFAVKMVPEDDPVWPSFKRYISDIPEQDRRFDEENRPKAELFAWLATRKNPGRMGAAIGAGDLSLDNEPSATFLKWLTELFA